MKQLRITVKEKLEFYHGIIIEQNKDVDDKRLERILEEIDTSICYSTMIPEIVSELEKHGLKVIKTEKAILPFREVEILDVCDVKEDKK